MWRHHVDLSHCIFVSVVHTWTDWFTVTQSWQFHIHFLVYSSNHKTIIFLLVASIGADHPLAPCSRPNSNQNTFINTYCCLCCWQYFVDSVVGITVISVVVINISAFDFCVYAICVLIVRKDRWRAFSFLLTFSLHFYFTLASLFAPSQFWHHAHNGSCVNSWYPWTIRPFSGTL